MNFGTAGTQFRDLFFCQEKTMCGVDVSVSPRTRLLG
jgi:hypothetical protein